MSQDFASMSIDELEILMRDLSNERDSIRARQLKIKEALEAKRAENKAAAFVATLSPAEQSALRAQINAPTASPAH